MNMVLSDSGIGHNKHVPVRFWIDLYHTKSKSVKIRDLSDLVTIAVEHQGRLESSFSQNLVCCIFSNITRGFSDNVQISTLVAIFDIQSTEADNIAGNLAGLYG